MQRDWHEFLSDKELEELDRKAEERAEAEVTKATINLLTIDGTDELEKRKKEAVCSMIEKGKKPEEICGLCGWSMEKLMPYLN